MARRTFDRFATKDFTRIFLWRHPETKGGEDGIVFGHTNAALTRRGTEQMKAIANFMSKEQLQAIYGSDLQRSMLVAEAVGRAQGKRLKPVVDKRLRELNLGIWEGLKLKEIQEKYPEEMEERYADLAGYTIKDGESLNDLAERIIPMFQKIVGDNQGAQVCVIGHGGVNRVFLAKILGMPMDRVFRIEQEYAHLNIIDVFEDGIPVLKVMNQVLPDR